MRKSPEEKPEAFVPLEFDTGKRCRKITINDLRGQKTVVHISYAQLCYSAIQGIEFVIPRSEAHRTDQKRFG